MRDLPTPNADADRVLDLARRDRVAAMKVMADLSLDEQVAVVCEAPVRRRAELLELAPAPEELIPRIPEAELCFTMKALGLESATWVLEHASPEQVVTALDLDAWSGHRPVPARLDAWLNALAETGDEALLRSVPALDPEILVHYLKGRIAVVQKPQDDEGWQPPEGAQTLEGQFYFLALRANDDVAAILRLVHLLFRSDYWTYFRMMQAVIHELPTDNQEWALRWRNARLQDLGFPPWEEAMSLYRHVPSQERARLPDDDRPLEVTEWHLPVWIPGLPEGRDSQHLVFRAVAQLSPDERLAAFYAFVAVANKVAVADHLELSDSETTTRAIEKAARWISRGLAHVAAENALEAREILRRASLERLFRVGANLDPAAARPPPAPEVETPPDEEA
jgi:hypothetical protein